jgi:hypothetical protein
VHKKRIRHSSLDKPLTIEEIHEIGLDRQIINEIQDDLFMYNEQNDLSQCSYLTDRPSDLSILKDIHATVTTEDASHYRALSELTHVVPCMQNVRLSDVLKLREGDGAAFARYRNSITTALQNSEFIEPNDYRDFYRSEIQPGIDSVENAINSARKSLLRDALFLGASLSISCAGLIVPELAPVAPTVGAVTGSVTAADLARSHFGKRDAAKTMNYYFLWRLGKSTNR